ncbi:MAG: hypothetical protein HKP56_16105 [Anderseniella sp.]|nr:hypothetical protein [Anderseniella sp.]
MKSERKATRLDDPVPPASSDSTQRSKLVFVNQLVWRIGSRASPLAPGRKDIGAWRLPAAELETLAINRLTQRLSDQTQLIELTQLHTVDATTPEQALASAKRLQDQAVHQTNEDIRTLTRMAIRRIDIRPGQMIITICPTSLSAVLLNQPGPISTNPSSDQVALTLPFQLRRRGVEAKLIVGNEIPNPIIDPKLVETIRNAHRWRDLLTSGNAFSVDSIAELDNIPASEISRILPLAFLAPDITKSVLTGNQPIDLTAERLRRIGKIPACRNEQRRVLRMPNWFPFPEHLELPLPST